MSASGVSPIVSRCGIETGFKKSAKVRSSPRARSGTGRVRKSGESATVLHTIGTLHLLLDRSQMTPDPTKTTFLRTSVRRHSGRLHTHSQDTIASA